jgi:O-methyltransferase
MQTNERSCTEHPARRSFRSRLSDFVNGRLHYLGYAVVRVDGNRPVKGATFHDAKYAYGNLYLPDIYSPWLIDDVFLHVWRAASPNTLTDIFRSYELYQCVSEVAGIPGDILEVGVWRGGTGAVLAAAAQRWKPDAKVWLCDTFSGVVKAGPLDAAYRGGEHADTSPETVESLLSNLQLTNTSVLKGVFPEDTASALSDRRIALCHIDVDVYQSAADIVTWLKPRMSGGSILIFDDYGFSTCKGITRLVNELRTSGDWIYIYNLNKHAVLIRR